MNVKKIVRVLKKLYKYLEERAISLTLHPTQLEESKQTNRSMPVQRSRLCMVARPSEPQNIRFCNCGL